MLQKQLCVFMNYAVIELSEGSLFNPSSYA